MAEKKNKKNINAGGNSIVIGGNVSGSNVVLGDYNNVTNQTVNIAPLFEKIYRDVDARKDLEENAKQDVKEELKEIQASLEEPKPDESFLARRFRNLKRMAPDITAVAIETLKNPISGVAEVIKRISKKIEEETK